MFEVNENLEKAAKLSLSLPLPEKQLVILSDASEHAAGHVFMTEDYTDTTQGPLKTHVSIAIASRGVTTVQMSHTM